MLAAAIERLVDSGRIPEAVLRVAIRAICAQRLREQRAPLAVEQERLAALVEELSRADIAVHTEAANQQHYEVPAELYRLTLGPHLKYSGCYWPKGVTSLAGAEQAMLDLTAARAELTEPGVRRVLDLGCGWGSFCLWAAALHPAIEVVALSNSASQRAFIEAEAARRKLTNLRVVTADVRVASLATLGGAPFDRVVSVEMFEHMRNYRALLAKIASWLTPSGKLFVHIFAHHKHAYPFETAGATDWMAREFFTGGLMPSTHLLHYFQEDLRLEQQWHIDGTHYARTAEAWHSNLLARWDDAVAVFSSAEPPPAAKARAHRWRVFFLACAEMFAYRQGREWLVAHYRFARRDAR